MNGAGLGIIAILVVALFAVSLGSQQVINEHTKLINEMSDQRQLLINTTQEALEQRDRELARSEILTEQVVQLTKDLDSKENEIAIKDAEISRLTAENQQQKDRIAMLSQNIPVSGQAGSNHVPTLSPDQKKETVFRKIVGEPITYLATQTGLKGIQVIFLLVLVGGILMGGGGYVISRSDSERKYTVHLTREQLKAYIRYQREH